MSVPIWVVWHSYICRINEYFFGFSISKIFLINVIIVLVYFVFCAFFCELYFLKSYLIVCVWKYQGSNAYYFYLHLIQYNGRSIVLPVYNIHYKSEKKILWNAIRANRLYNILEIHSIILVTLKIYKLRIWSSFNNN